MEQEQGARREGRRKGRLAERRQEHQVPLLSSIRFRIDYTVGIAVFVAVVSILLVVTIPVRKELKAVNSSYLYMTTTLYGQKLETVVNITENNIDIRKVPARLESFLQDAKMEGCESSCCYLVREDGIVLYHPDHDKIGRQTENEIIQQVAAQVKGGTVPEPDIVAFKDGGKSELLSYYASDKGFVLAISVEEGDFFHTLNMMTQIAIVTGVVVFLIMQAFGLLQALRITRPIDQVTQIVDQIGDLDFTGDARIQELQERKDETGMIARSVEHMRRRLVSIVERIQEQSQALYGTAIELHKNAQDTSEDASHIEDAVGEIATGAVSQAGETQRANEDVSIIGRMIQDTGTQVSDLSDTANQMRQASEEAFGILAELASINQKTASSIERIYQQTNETNASAVKIKEAAGLIASIASETNLLSLNASIEAARAGEAGRGFAVVASEIQKLAEESSSSAKSIDTIIQELVANSTEAVQIMDEVREVMSRQNEMVGQTEEAFRSVRKGIDGSLGNANHIREGAQQLDTARVNIVSTVENLSAIAEQNAASSQETSDTMGNIIRALQVVADNSVKLNEVAKVLDDSINEIRIEGHGEVRR